MSKITDNLHEVLETPKGALSLPAFLPDATKGFVRTIDARDIKNCGIDAVMVNIIHLSSHPGISVIKNAGGIHRFMAWDGHLFSDSGGFQVFSLISGGNKMGSITNRGFVYRLTKGGKKKTLTPEKSIRKQFQVGADVLFCLDYCTHPEADYEFQLESVRITIDWARRCKQEYERLLEEAEPPGKRPLLFAVIQGGSRKDLRKMCCEALFEIGFDGYGFGGWPVDKEGNLVEAVEWVREIIQNKQVPLHGLGIGKPENIIQAYKLGYRLFDCVLPTRDARHNRLYTYKNSPEDIDFSGNNFYEYIYIQDNKYVRDGNPVEDTCDCYCCTNYSRAYLHHLFKSADPLLHRLSTIHNLRFYSRLMKALPG